MTHYFTREEAEALLPQVSVILHAIQQEHVKIQQEEEEQARLEIKARGNGHDLHKHFARLQREMRQSIQALRRLTAQLEELGCELKDPATGLIDFRGLRDGREIYLCWRLGEERILFWHELHTGLAGRQPF